MVFPLKGRKKEQGEYIDCRNVKENFKLNHWSCSCSQWFLKSENHHKNEKFSLTTALVLHLPWAMADSSQLFFCLYVFFSSFYLSHTQRYEKGRKSLNYVEWLLVVSQPSNTVPPTIPHLKLDWVELGERIMGAQPWPNSNISHLHMISLILLKESSTFI